MGARRGRGLVAGSCLALALLGGGSVAHATGDSTGESTPAADAGAQATATARPTGDGVRPVASPVPPSPVVPVDEGSAVDPAAVQAAVADELENPWLGGRVSVTVRDALTGEHLMDAAPDRETTPASLTKLLTAAAIVTVLPMEETFDTTVVGGVGQQADDIYLVSGGDMLLDRGHGDPDAVVGRAGLADLAEQVARARGPEAPPVTLHVDAGYGAGELAAPGWSDYWLAEGYTGPITMLGLGEDRAFVYHPAPRNPTQVTAAAFAEALEDAGVPVEGDADDQVPKTSAPEDAELLATVSSAPAGEVLTLALADSDNAMVEQLARQAAIRAGIGVEREDINQWVIDQVAGYGIDVSGVRLSDTSGLSDGTTIPARVVGDVLVAGTSGEHPELERVLGDLPIAGYTGTLHDRFLADRQEPARGVARAKTGSLPGVTSLGGTVVTRDDRLLVYVIIADRVDEPLILEARATTEDFVTELARCGC
ncbi:D-alanyl-D-alanine carboxypeptidase/D-alanyl-D-alanine-endopeptidase [Ornithinicoccus hortensis]|uniref:D-alanyl-D-alanine carboxypeptidase/D-alanyl-D-alanine-endopeptidase (Penicillin-binding protein 4) n=1 Tax=Ornithinicoccus hortensis TaxID=82346 RepID=A0A542YVX8_9MICO|nr:D-alanyl-D-alanine carboxypeptidase [Ornithinicoccus hortensis]TQL52246.1 D-alanyl-D-alanine carboxypeptidase/D-alanyl-D-alanine-endopeptidase (penicillin-binding protein 4) [Ornithinicoccus hortensis]